MYALSLIWTWLMDWFVVHVRLVYDSGIGSGFEAGLG